MQQTTNSDHPSTTSMSWLPDTLAGLGMGVGLGLLAAGIKTLSGDTPELPGYLAFVAGGLLFAHGLLWKIRRILREENQRHPR